MVDWLLKLIALNGLFQLFFICLLAVVFFFTVPCVTHLYCIQFIQLFQKPLLEQGYEEYLQVSIIPNFNSLINNPKQSTFSKPFITKKADSKEPAFFIYCIYVY